MENWRAFNNKQLLQEKKASELLNDFEAAKQQLDNIKDEKKRKEFIGKLFVGVAGVGIAISLAPAVAAILGALGLKLGVFKIGAQIAKSGFGQFFQALPPEAQDALLDRLPDYKDKLKGGALNLVNKMLNIPDEESAKSEFLRKIDLPDKLNDVLEDKVYNEVVAAIKQKLINLGDQDLDGTTMQLAARLLRKKYTITIGDPRVKMSESKREGKRK